MRISRLGDLNSLYAAPKHLTFLHLLNPTGNYSLDSFDSQASNRFSKAS